MAKLDRIRVPVSPGELLDKITILEIKSQRLADPVKLAHVRRELAELHAARAEAVPALDELATLTAELRALNETLWEVEDAIRGEEAAERFGPRFVALARAVYRTNDRRADIKKRINELLGSAIAEQKSYTAYADASQSAPPTRRSVARLVPASSSRR